MFVRVSKTSRGDTTYAYAQLVKSYRRKPDGMPQHEIIANLGRLSELEVENLRASLKASRQGRAVVMAVAPSASPKRGGRPPKSLASQRYLDVAVACALWREWGLDRIVREMMPRGEREVADAQVVEALVVQRLVAPGSKLKAARWFAGTALPELQGIAPGQFNNTRIHRVLDELDANTTTLMAKLPKLYQERTGAFASLFLDVTDTWFVGHGPEDAVRAKTKEGLVRRKIGIVLLCNEHGYPLRWEVVRGNCSDVVAMSEMIEEISGLNWVGEAPVVVDRAMGSSAQIRLMAASNRRFLTALRRTEFSTYANKLPWKTMETLRIDDADDAVVAADAAGRAEAAGMQRVDDKLFVVDMGVVNIASVDLDADADADDLVTDVAQDANAEALRRCRQASRAVTDGRYSSYAAAGAAVGLKKGVLAKYRKLLKLPEDVQRRILEGHSAAVPLQRLIDLAKVDDAQVQRRDFEALVQAASGRQRAGQAPASPDVPPAADPPGAGRPLRVRVVAYFNPACFVDRRRTAMRKLLSVTQYVEALNDTLAGPRSKRTPARIRSNVEARLRRHDMLELFDITIKSRTDNGREHHHVELTLDADTWRQRRRYDGFSVLVGHPDLPQSASALCELYRAKDKVDKDFQVIKSLAKLRPVRHRNDPKVRAHVTICMLALLIERTLGRKLSGKTTGAAALEVLASCRLDRYDPAHGPAGYSCTTLTKEQRSLLRKLRLLHLADDDHLATVITPR